MRHLLGAACVAAVVLGAAPAAAAVSVTYEVPAAGSIQSGFLVIRVNVVSDSPVMGVRATIGASSANMVPTSPGATTWHEAIDVRAMPRGPLTISVTATDVFAASATATRMVVHDEVPTIMFTAPVVGTVAHPTVRVTATCSDDDTATGCLGFGVYLGSGAPLAGPLLAAGTGNTLDATIDLSAYANSTPAVLAFYARDSAGRYNELTQRVHVEPNPALVEIASLGQEILDLDATRILYLAEDSTVHVYRRSDGADTALGPMVWTTSHRPYARLTSTGAIYGSLDAPSDRLDFYEWRAAGAPVLFGSYADFVVKAWLRGDYALVGIPPAGTVTRRNLATGATTTLTYRAYMTPTQGGGFRHAVGDDGDVCGLNYDPNPPTAIYYACIRDGVYAELGTTTDYYGDIVTDGQVVVFTTRVSTEGDIYMRAIDMFDVAGTRIRLSDPVLGPQPGEAFQAAGGWVAFRRPSTPGGVLQVWRRSPAGLEERLAPFSTDSRIDAMSPAGDVTFTHSSARYLGVPGDMPLRVSARHGRSLFADGLYLLLGRTALRLGAGPPPPVDAGVPDAMLVDAGVPDAASSDPDATSPDAGTDPPSGGSGGGCSVATNPDGLALLGLALAILLAPRRRRAHPRTR